VAIITGGARGIGKAALQKEEFTKAILDFVK
jgi:hypothetical protein